MLLGILRKFTVPLLALNLCFSLDAQSIIQGHISDYKTKEPIIGALLIADSSSSVSDNEGRYALTLNSGRYELLISYSTYKTIVKSIILQKDQIITLDFAMEESNILLDVAEISTSRFEKPITESPISIDVIKPINAERLNSVTADQVIDKVPGVQILDGQVNIRGGSGYSYGAGSRVMLIMDDLQILQPDAGFTNWGDLPLENVGQIEIVKGAASALYGSAAMNGIIHFRTIKPSLEPFTSIAFIPRFFLKPTNNNEWWGRDKGNSVIPSDIAFTFVHRKKYKIFDLSLGGLYRNEVSFNKNTGQENYRLSGNVVRHISDKLIIGLGFNFNKGRSSSFFYWDSIGSYQGSPNSFSSSKKLRFNIDPSLQYFTSQNYRHRILTRWLHVNNNNDNNQSNTSENIFTEYQIQKEYNKLGLGFTAGVLVNQFRIDAPLFSDTIFRNNNYAAYLQIEEKPIKNLIISLGVRYELFQTNGPSKIDTDYIKNPVTEDRPVYRLGINYRLLRGSFLRASIGQGFRFPTLAEKYIRTSAGGFNIIPNKNLNSEYGQSSEIGIKQGLKIGNYQGFIDLSTFYSKYQDMIEFTVVINNSGFFYQAQNVGDTKISGLELSNQGIFDFGNKKIVYNGGITFLNPRFQEWDITGKDVPVNLQDTASKAQRNAFSSTSYNNVLKYRSKQLAKIDVEFQYKKLFAGVNFNYTSNVEAIDWLFEVDIFIPGAKAFRQQHNFGYRIYDFRCGYSFTKLDLQFNIQNAFNEVYTTRPGLMEAPRSIGGRIVWKI
ncbi:MAG: TonB-dependent receptor [Saprospiraceae bacterium]